MKIVIIMYMKTFNNIILLYYANYSLMSTKLKKKCLIDFLRNSNYEKAKV